MKCLCCNKPIQTNASPYEFAVQWHNKCIKDFFNTSVLPELDISEENLKLIAAESTQKGFTVPGVQKKLSLHLTQGDEPRLTLVNYPAGYILKPQTEEYKNLPEAEYLVMQMAKATGIQTVPFALIKISERYAYITKRIDRIISRGSAAKLAMEDFCQLEERLTQDKYKGSYERCAKVIKKYSAKSGFDLSELFLRLVFSFAAGNSDMHLKNFSLIQTQVDSPVYVLSAAYDMLPVNAVLPQDNEQFALTMNGKKSNIRKKDFIEFAYNIGLLPNSAEKLITSVTSKIDIYLKMCDESLIENKTKQTLKQIIAERISYLA